MDSEEYLTARLWLEQHEGSANGSSSRYLSLDYPLNSSLRKSIDQFTKATSISWDTILHSAFGLLLNRFCSADTISYGKGIICSAKSGQISVSNSLIQVKSRIDDKLTFKNHLAKTRAKIGKKTKHPASGQDELRYILLTATKKNSPKNQQLLNPNKHPFILLDAGKQHKTLKCYYSNALARQNVKSLMQHLERIIQHICEDYRQKVVSVSILTNTENRKILSQWYKSAFTPTKPDRLYSVSELFRLAARQYPYRLAISHNHTQVSYQDLAEASTLLSRHLVSRGIKVGDRICVIMDRTPSLITTMLAIFNVGGVFIPINPKYPQERIDYILEDAKPTIIIANDPQQLQLYRQQTLRIDKSYENLKLDIKPVDADLPKINPDDLAYIIYTSGSTGTPKGVMVQHKSLANLTPFYTTCFNVTCKDRASQFASQAFDTYLCETVPYLTVGASVHIVDDNIKLTPSLFFEWLTQEKITILDLSTSYALMLFALEWPINSSLRLVKIGGEHVTSFPNRIFSFDIWNGYGPTEATIESTFMKIYEANTPPRNYQKNAPPPIGRPIRHCEVYVVDKYLQPVPIGVAGELLIGGRILSVGYLNKPELTKQKFISHLFNPNTSEKLYRTGDLVRWTPDGNLDFIGRIDHQVKIRGYRVELSEIENVLSRHPDVNEAFVIAKQTMNGDKSLVAYIAPDLDKERYPYQDRCILSINNQCIEAITEDISKNGVAITGISQHLNIGQQIQIQLKLPGYNTAKLYSCYIIWQQDNRCGLLFDLNDQERKDVYKSIEYYLSTHNVMELVLSASAKRSLRRALKKKLPEYMVPSVFVTLLQLPLTLSGKVDVKALPEPMEYEKSLQKEFIYPKTATEKQLSAIWQDILKISNISMSDNYFEIGGNSLTTAELSIRILDKFGITIPTKLLFDLSYIPIQAEYIDSNGKHYQSESIIQDEIAKDSVLHENIIPCNKSSTHAANPENILLTGAGGFLGIFLLKELLEQTNAKIYCLIRNSEFESAAKRLHSTIHKFGLSPYLSLTERRIIAISSDISFDKFGLPEEQYQQLLNKIDVIYHCGAQVNIMASYKKLRGSNVLGTHEIIKFATQAQDKPIHYISTLSAVCEDKRSGILLESFPQDGYQNLSGGYALSKWVSERLLTQLKDRGHPVYIYRSGYISGSTANGSTSLNDALLMLIKGCIQLKYAPDMHEKITFLPVDFVSKAISTLSLKTTAKNAVYHIDHPTGIMWTDLVAWLNNFGYKIKIIPMQEWQKMLIAIPNDNAIYPFIPYYMSLPDNYRSPDAEITKASALLQKHQLSYPEINDQLLTLYFDYLCKAGFLPAPTSLLGVHSKEENH